MVRFAWLALAVSACGTTDDNRPLEAQYVTAAVLAPTCGAAECHSTFAQQKGDVFDTLEGMRRSIVNNGLVILDSIQFDPSDPANATLILWVTKTDPLGLGIGRMPFAAPMPNEDIHFLENWIVGPTKIRDDKTPCSATLACPSGDTCQFVTPGAATGNCVNITYLNPAHGAQCNPGANGGVACFNLDRVMCTPDWNFGTKIETCPNDCTLGTCI